MKFQIRIFLGLVRGIAWMLKNERKKESVHCGLKELELHSADRENSSRSTKDFSTRWKSPFHSFMRLRFERVSLLRFSLQKVCSTRRSKTVPVFLKRNWIHKSVEGSRRTRRVHLAFLRSSQRPFLFPRKPKGCLTREKARVPRNIFPASYLSILLSIF